MRFYSGKGDKGTSTLYGSGKRLSKTDKVFEALGALDELNSYLGVCLSLSRNKKIKKTLDVIQENLFIIQAEVGNIGTSDVPKLDKNKLSKLENITDKFGGEVGIITKFSLSGETLLSAHLDYARTLARRAERSYLASRTPSDGATAYLNRLSSLLFVLARYANKKAGKRERNPGYK